MLERHSGNEVTQTLLLRGNDVPFSWNISKS